MSHQASGSGHDGSPANDGEAVVERADAVSNAGRFRSTQRPPKRERPTRSSEREVACTAVRLSSTNAAGRCP
jgi:hypothetical protein